MAVAKGRKMRFFNGTETKIKILAFNFREAIEKAKDNDEPGAFFRNFPYGQCGNTSDLLAQFFIDNGIGPITYVSGTYYGNDLEDRWSHAWLSVDDLIIDITGDQFKYHKGPLTYDIPVYIGPMTDFYRLFEIGTSGKCEHLGLEEQWVHYPELKKLYEIILKYLR